MTGYFGVDGGTVNITGGELTGGFMFNNGGAEPTTEPNETNVVTP